jgi:hypothetical protein
MACGGGPSVFREETARKSQKRIRGILIEDGQTLIMEEAAGSDEQMAENTQGQKGGTAL